MSAVVSVIHYLSTPITPNIVVSVCRCGVAQASMIKFILIFLNTFRKMRGNLDLNPKFAHQFLQCRQIGNQLLNYHNVSKSKVALLTSLSEREFRN